MERDVLLIFSNIKSKFKLVTLHFVRGGIDPSTDIFQDVYQYLYTSMMRSFLLFTIYLRY